MKRRKRRAELKDLFFEKFHLCDNKVGGGVFSLGSFSNTGLTSVLKRTRHSILTKQH